MSPNKPAIRATFKQTLLGTENAVLELVNTFNELLHEYDLHGVTVKEVSTHAVLKEHEWCSVGKKGESD